MLYTERKPSRTFRNRDVAPLRSRPSPSIPATMSYSPQLLQIKLIPQHLFINQIPLLIKQNPLTLKQLSFRLLILPTRHLLPIPFETTNKLITSRQPMLCRAIEQEPANQARLEINTYPSTSNTPMTRYLRCKRITPQRAAHSARRTVQRSGQGGVCCNATFGYLLEERVDAFLVLCDFLCFGHCGCGN